MDSNSLILSVLCGIVALLSLGWIAGWNKPKYLPGPPAWPIIGNLLQMPSSDSWETYTKWKKLYGDAVYVNVMRSPIVILNTYQACSDLLEKRSDMYSDRPLSLLCRKIMGWERALTLAPYGDLWKRSRRMAAQSLRKEAVKQYLDIQQKDVVKYLGSLLTEPEKFVANIRLTSGHSLMKSIYGVDVESPSDPIVAIAEEAVDYALNALTPGNFLVDFFPLLQYIPGWIPGTGWKRFAAQGKKLCDQMADIPFEQTVADMAKGTYDRSFTSVNLENGEDPYMVKWCSGTMYTVLLHPEVQRKAQAEIDTVVGNSRLPDISDRENLPYVNSVMKEVMRWLLVMPLALPHRLVQDDVYNGAVPLIPKGAMVIGNAWAISRDENIYENPESFNPDRFLPLFDKSITPGPLGLPLDPEKYAFGFGRRICAGIHYADTMVFLIISNVLAGFSISPVKNADGADMLPRMEFISSMVREPVPFQCSITVRSPAAKSLIETHLSSYN
ncbi:cytochrome P450 [Cyathus striatus]|nr:cytochrome P450 [Cyathus striatus]